MDSQYTSPAVVPVAIVPVAAVLFMYRERHTENHSLACITFRVETNKLFFTINTQILAMDETRHLVTLWKKCSRFVLLLDLRQDITNADYIMT